MSEERTARQLNNAVESLKRKYTPDDEEENSGDQIYKCIKLKDSSCPFHLEVFRNSNLKGQEIFKFRVTLDKISEEDEALCRGYRMPEGVFTKLIACKIGRGRWIFKEIS